MEHVLNIKLIIILLLLFSFSSCDKVDEFKPRTEEPVPGKKPDPGEEPVISQNEYIVKWILSTMKENYLWSSNIPSKTDSTLLPTNFYKSILYKYGSLDGDRFSQIISTSSQKNQKIQTATPKSGYDYVLLGTSGGVNIYAYINYVVKGSPAESAGLKRGDLFIQINGVQLTRANYVNLINQTTTTHTITKAIISSSSSLLKDKEITVSVAYFDENPIFLDTMYNISNKKIGYLVYNSFTQGDDNDAYKYDYQLNKVFGEFKEAGVTDLVLDLRYNGGGSLTSVVHLASMIMSSSYKNKVFVERTYNEVQQKKYADKYGNEYFLDRFKQNINNEPINNLDVSKLYVLMSYRTASGSELIINGLKPYIDVVLIGRDKTVGKNIGSIIINSNDKKIPWQLRPIVVRLSNSEGFTDYTSGFTPDVWKNEFELVNPKALGDETEVLLGEAIRLIAGTRILEPEDPVGIHEPISSNSELNPDAQVLYIQ